jgi:hypothetical protein
MGAGSAIGQVSPAMGVNPDGTTTPNGQSTANNAVQIVSPSMGQNPDGSYNYGTTQNTQQNPNFIQPIQQPGAGGLSSLVSQQPMYSSAQPTTNALQSFIGSNTNPYANTTSPYFGAAQAQTLGNLAGAQQAVQANRVNQNTAYGGLQYQQGTDQYGNPTWTANQTTNPQTQGLINSSLGNLQSAQNNPLYGINPGENYSDAIMRRLLPQIAQSDQSQTAALANQGIVPGTVAYDNAMRTYNQSKNDLLTSAQIGGMNTGLQAQSLLGTQAGQIKNLATPNLINAPTQAAVAGPDYTGALATQTNANIAAQNAALGQQTANTAGLYGLGSAGILGLAANPGLLSSAANGIGNAYNYLTTPSTSAGYMNSIGATSSGAFNPALSNSDYLTNQYGLNIF